ncbi:undecaprenyl diphosphate synthase family protein [Candidatus Saccharibacteria bacterium]|nr:undecaprenyl diphosphate synthase family protein [Candidatus Saccharibacteria bacterium]
MSLVHLGIIADGNRRWAKEHGLPKIEGHKRGLKTIETLVAAAARAKIPFITFYVFSTENWGREESEVSYIMKLAETKIMKMAEKWPKIMFGF